MHKIYRIMIVIILVMAFAILAMDYIGFHGSIILDRIAGGSAVDALDALGMLFQGPNAFTNFMFVGIISLGLLVCILAIIYKFIKG